MVSTADWTAATRWTYRATCSARDAPVPIRSQNAQLDGGAARLTEARESIMQRKTKRRPDAFAAERRRAAPYTRPDKISANTFRQVTAILGNGLRSRERRFESCRMHSSEA